MEINWRRLLIEKDDDIVVEIDPGTAFEAVLMSRKNFVFLSLKVYQEADRTP